ncbi:hypothetical protein GOP47_0011927 [Adiantum capillus-veneris]|uniref:Uncharacterized protein n=1 Tax=Adiantum capillus-veneris TaxID=13818 RepID=A0A9D4ZFV1_ADICA|nr:hypothetical protein GOP47_0011927 [Adiantum capillus-veneris]
MEHPSIEEAYVHKESHVHNKGEVNQAEPNHNQGEDKGKEDSLESSENGQKDGGKQESHNINSVAGEVIIGATELESWYKHLMERVVIGLCHAVRPPVEVLKQWTS